jgi:hypothetical protein
VKEDSYKLSFMMLYFLSQSFIVLLTKLLLLFFSIKVDHSILFVQSYEVNSRGLEIFSKSWLPATSHPKAMVYYCHGYGDTCTFFCEGMELCFFFFLG